MKYNQKGAKANTHQKKTPVVEETPAAIQEEKEAEQKPMEADVQFAKSSNSVDLLQEKAYEAGVRLISVLNKKKLDEDRQQMEHAREALHQLGHFTYNIGFAGEQSCGKSTVIDSILQYPIMPTCTLTTTASVVQMIYSDHVRVRAMDDDSGKVVLDFDCMAPAAGKARVHFEEQFRRLLDYGVNAMKVLTIENFQYFSDVDVLDDQVTVDDIQMSVDNPRHILLLMLILLAVYVGQNDKEWDDKTRQLMEKRQELFRYFGIPENTINLSVICQCDFDVLKSGLVITDLPGLGSNAQQQERKGKMVKSHDDITKEAIGKTDTMVFITTPENRRQGYEVLPEMLSNAKLNETVKKGDRIIPLLNKADSQGTQQKETAIDSFIRTLEMAGFKKQREEVHLYSAIFGECKFSEFPFERTLFYMKNYSEREISRKMRRGFSEEEAIAEHKQELKEDLQDMYEESGVETLKQFFRTKFVEIGKYNQATAAVHAVKNLVRYHVSRLESELKSIEGMGEISRDIQLQFIQKMHRAVLEPIASIVAQKNADIAAIQLSLSENVHSKLKNIPNTYMDALRKGLNTYKSKLTETINGFDLTWGGFGSKARIDQAGSANRSRYYRLMEQINDFPISLIPVNNKYIETLDSISKTLEKFYQETVKELEMLKKDIFQSIRTAVDALKEQVNDPSLVKTFIKLQDQMLSFVDTQISVILAANSQQAQEVKQAQQDIVDAIFKVNSQMVQQYTRSVQNDLRSCINQGFWLSSRDYLMIDGENGIRDAVRSLDLNDSDSSNVKQNIKAAVNSLVENDLPQWTNQLFDTIKIYETLKNRVDVLIQEIKKAADAGQGEREKRCREILRKLAEWKTAANAYKKDVQPFMEQAFLSMNDQEPNNQALKDDILNGCFQGEEDH